ncbi:MAG: hypothetical protein J2P57_04945 [Acidimicrobiaceae bacterium]|nr:hypothetical protein [Acidimicrobiaceae bacterium]
MSSSMALAAIIAIVVAMAGMNLGVVYFLVSRIDRRLERIEERLGKLEVTVAEIGQKLNDHIEHHPGPTERLVRSGSG